MRLTIWCHQVFNHKDVITPPTIRAAALGCGSIETPIEHPAP